MSTLSTRFLAPQGQVSDNLLSSLKTSRKYTSRIKTQLTHIFQHNDSQIIAHRLPGSPNTLSELGVQGETTFIIIMRAICSFFFFLIVLMFILVQDTVGKIA